jgi:hypothetical protein
MRFLLSILFQEKLMRSLLVLGSAILLTACAGQQTMPEKAAPAPAPVAAPAPTAAPIAASAPAPAPKKVAQCYSGDEDKFFNVGDKAKIAGIDATCGTNSDGTVGQWATGAGHHKK